MKSPRKLEVEIKRFGQQVEAWSDDELLDAWIAHKDRLETVPDLDFQKSILMEQELIRRYGLKYKAAVKSRRSGNAGP